jgi:hypothetical protein
MQRRTKKTLIFVLGLSLVLVSFGCAPITKTVNPQFEMRAKDIKTAGFLSPDIKVYEFTAGGMRELRDDWCAKGKENVQRAMLECLREKPFEVKPITIDQQMEEEMEDIYALYRAVSASIIVHTLDTRGKNQFPEKLKNFDYSIGSVENILKKYGGDALIFVAGFDEISTAGRQALKAVGIIAGVAAAAAGVGGAVIIPRSGITMLSVALVDSSGTILWYNTKGSAGGYDLRDPQSATTFVRETLSDYPGAKK